MRRSVVVAAVTALLATGCGGSTDQQVGASPVAPSPTTASAQAQTFVVTSPDFVDGAALPASTKANAFGGQCEGENLNPALTWTGAPAETESFAIIMVDLSAGNFLHWSHADIPATVTGVDAGGAETLAGVGGNLAVADGSYFGPCPPDPDHHYVFTVYALDTTLDLAPDYRIADLRAVLDTHTLAEASIVGVSSP